MTEVIAIDPCASMTAVENDNLRTIDENIRGLLCAAVDRAAAG